MPARKPLGLHTRHSTKAEIDARAAAESSMTPERELPRQAPARLRDHEVAAETWRRLMRLYGELEASIVTRLDQDILVDYCLLCEQIGQIDTMRKAAYQAWLDLGLAADAARTKAKQAKANAKELARAGMEDQVTGALEEAERAEKEMIALATRCVDAFDAVLKLDARADQKRKTLHQLRQSLYLTPRSRAGAAPEKREEEEPLDPMDALLGSVTSYVNGDGREQ